MRGKPIHWLVASLVAVAPVFAGEASIMVLEGDVSAVYTNGDFVVWNPKPGGGAMAMSVAATPASRVASPRSPEKPPSIESTLDVVAKAPIGADGKFRLEATVGEPRRVYFYVLNALTSEGRRLAPVKGNAFILEPGQLELRMSRSSRFVIDGGYYNDAVYNGWRLSEDYLAAQAELDRLRAAEEGETEEDRRRRVEAMMEAQHQVFDLESEGRSRIARTHPDPLVRRLTIETTWLSGPWMLDALRGLTEMTPDDPWVAERLASAETSAAKRERERKRFAVGADIRDFTAETLDGEEVRLADVRADSRYVLLEFWASWCGPCRTEIPHMKEVYARYKERAFEIVSFTIDEEREAWEEASAQEQLPWINLGMGPEADAPVAYNVTGVPKNYLVESSTGDIVAKDLRGHHLEEKVAELLDVDGTSAEGTE